MGALKASEAREARAQGVVRGALRHALKAQGAETIVWSVGGLVPIAHLAAATAKKYKWNMVRRVR